jgi:hypothetical protein
MLGLAYSTPDCWLVVSLHPERPETNSIKVFRGFLGPRANVELVPKFHVALHASHAALQIFTFQNFRHNIALPKSDYISPTTAAPTYFKSKLNKSFTRRTSGHCLGTFQTAKLCFDYTPPPYGSVARYPPASLSLKKLKDRAMENVQNCDIGADNLTDIYEPII